MKKLICILLFFIGLFSVVFAGCESHKKESSDEVADEQTSGATEAQSSSAIMRTTVATASVSSIPPIDPTPRSSSSTDNHSRMEEEELDVKQTREVGYQVIFASEFAGTWHKLGDDTTTVVITSDAINGNPFYATAPVFASDYLEFGVFVNLYGDPSMFVFRRSEIKSSSGSPEYFLDILLDSETARYISCTNAEYDKWLSGNAFHGG